MPWSLVPGVAVGRADFSCLTGISGVPREDRKDILCLVVGKGAREDVPGREMAGKCTVVSVGFSYEVWNFPGKLESHPQLGKFYCHLGDSPGVGKRWLTTKKWGEQIGKLLDWWPAALVF